MRITIIGAGTIGTHLAKYLSGEQMDIVIVDQDPAKLADLDSEYNLKTIEGDATEFATLQRADAGKSELFIAVTNSAERNIVLCGLGKSLGARQTVARVNRADYIDASHQQVLRSMGVDKAIFPEYLLARGILESLKHPWARTWYAFNHGAIIMAGIRLAADAPLVGRCLRDVSIGQRVFHVVAVRRNYTTIIPKGDCQLQADDILYVTATASRQTELLAITGKQNYDIRRVLLSGGGKVAELLLTLAPKSFHFTVIESDRQRAEQLLLKSQRCEVILGEFSEQDVLEEARIRKADAFIALTDVSEGNVLSCLTARELGVRKTIAYVEQHHFFNRAESFQIGTIVNKQMLMANTIFQLMLDAGSLSSKCFSLPDAEMVRLEIKADARITQAPVKDLKLPADITIAAMVRNGQSELVTGQTQFQAGDQVLVVCLPGTLQKAKKLFN